MKTLINLQCIILLLLFSDGLLAQNDLSKAGATVKKDTIAFAGNSTYTNINAKSWDQILAEDTLKWKPPYTIHMPIQPVHSPDFIHIDCALNAIRRRVLQNLSIKDHSKKQNQETFLIQFAFDDPPFVPDFNLSKLSLANNRYPVVTGEYLALGMRYRIEYSCSAVDENQSLLWVRIMVSNKGEKTQQSHVRAKINFQMENDLKFNDYKPFYWDADSWLPCDRVKLENNSIVKDNHVIGKIVSESMNVNWESEAHFQDNDFINKFGIDNQYFLPNMRLKEVQDVIHAQGELKPGEEKTFSIALLTNNENITESQLSFLEKSSAKECQVKAINNFKSQFTKENTEMLFPTDHWQDIFTELQISTLQLLVKFPGKDSLMPTQGGNNHRSLDWTWEAVYMLRPMLRTGHFEPVRKGIDYIFSLQDAGLPPEGRFTTTRGSIGTTSLRWICTTGSALALACDYYIYSNDKDFLEQYLPKILKASRWIVGELRATRKLNPDGSRPLYYGLMPFGVATDGDIGYVISFTDAYTFWGLEKTVKLLEDIKHVDAGEFRKEMELYRGDLAIAINGLSQPNGFINKRIITNDKETVIDESFKNDGSIIHLAYTGAINIESDIFQRFISYFEQNGAVDYFMQNQNENPDIAYMTVSEFIFQYIYLSSGQWKKAFAANRVNLQYGMTQDTYQVLERFSRSNPGYSPFQPNGSGNGRIMDMMLNSIYFETEQGVTLLGGIPFAWLQKNKKTSLRKLYTTTSCINIEITAINPKICTVSLSSDNRKVLPVNIRFPEYLHATTKSPSVVNIGNGFFKVTDQVDHLVFNISND